MNTILQKLKCNNKLKKVLHILQCIFLFLYVFSLPSFSGRHGYNYISYIFVTLLAILTAIVILLYRRITFKWHMLVLPAFGSWAILGTSLFSHEFREWLSIIFLIISFFVIYFSFISLDNTTFILFIIIAAFITFCFYFICIYFKDILNYKSFSGQAFRLGDYFDNVNQIGSYLSIAFALSLYLVFFSKKKIFLLFILPCILFAFIGFTTGSKTFILSIFIVVLVTIFIRFKKQKLFLFLSLVSLIVTFVVLINLPFLSALKSRLMSMIDSMLIGNEYDGSTITRLLWQIYGIFLGSKQMIIGYGNNGFSIYSGVGTYSHANYAELICNFGIIGLIIFYFAIVYPIYRAYKCPKSNAIKIILVLGILLVCESFMLVFYNSKTTYIIFALFFYLLDTHDVCLLTSQVDYRYINI